MDIYTQTYMDYGDLRDMAVGDPSYRERFDFEWLANELTQYGIVLETPSKEAITNVK